MRSAALILGILLCFAACKGSAVEAIPGIVTHYPLADSLRAWFNTPAAEGNFKVVRVTKDTQDSNRFTGSHDEWEDHLGLFLSLDIQKPALYGFYSVDTLPKGDSHVQFKALRAKDRVQKLTIALLNDRLMGFSGEIVRSNPLYYSSYTLEADLSRPYFRVEGFQHLSFPERYQEISVTISRHP